MKKLHILCAILLGMAITSVAGAEPKKTAKGKSSGVPVHKGETPAVSTNVFVYGQRPTQIVWAGAGAATNGATSVYEWREDGGILVSNEDAPQHPKRGEQQFGVWPGNAGFSTQADRNAVAAAQYEQELAQAAQMIQLQNQGRQRQYRASSRYSRGRYSRSSRYSPYGHVAAGDAWIEGGFVITPRYNRNRYNNPDYPWQRSYKTERLEADGYYRNYR